MDRTAATFAARARWHSVDPDEAAGQLGADPARGLSGPEAARRLSIAGPNGIEGPPPPTRLARLFTHFGQPVTAILVVATAIAAFLGDAADAALVAAILVIDAAIGVLMEERATLALERLRALAAPSARGTRDGIPWSGPAAEVVVGDLLEIAAGDVVPADMRLVTASGLRIDESSLTGEAGAVGKDAEARIDANTPLGDRATVTHAGTTVVAGRGRGIVFATGMETELGRIAMAVAGVVDRSTPLERRMARLGRLLVAACLGLVATIAAVEGMRGAPLDEVLSRALSLAVASVPEGLPAVVTVILAVGVGRMAARHVLVRRLPAVETLGAVTVICTDKTGTLTANRMTLAEVAAGRGRWDVTGDGDAIVVRPRIDHLGTAADLGAFFACAAGCARQAEGAVGGGVRPADRDPIDTALFDAARRAGAIRPEGEWREIPFDPATRKSGAIVESAARGRTEFAKGAPEAILADCRIEGRDGVAGPLTTERRAEWERRAAEMAADGLRVIGLARRDGSGEVEFVGLAGIVDPPRESARTAVKACRAAGVRPVVITGDHPATALAVARAVGIADVRDRAIAADELERMDDAALGEAVGEVAVFARASASHKVRIVTALRSRGEVVAMTGDGVNDAPAIRAADVGIAMGRGGCDVTREAADMVLTDDALASIVAAIEEGRTIDDNVGQVLHYLLACNGGEVLTMFAAALAGLPAPLAPFQILWLNLVTDGAPALALGLEPHDPAAMPEGPRHRGGRPLVADRWASIASSGGSLAAVALAAFVAVLAGDEAGFALPRARSAAFAVMAFAQLLLAAGCRSARRGVFTASLALNGWLVLAVVLSAALQAGALVAAPAEARLDAGAWWVVVSLAPVPLAVHEIGKVLRRRPCREHFRRPRRGARLPGDVRDGETLPDAADRTAAREE